MSPQNLPSRMRCNSAGVYYYDHGRDASGKRCFERLGKDLAQAKIRWAQIEAQAEEPAAKGTVASVLDYYEKQHLPELGERTQRDRRVYLRNLRKVMGHIGANALRPQHVASYLESRGSPVSANREITTLAVAYRKAMRIGMVNSNPCDGVQRNPEKPRSRYITDAEFLAVKALFDPWFQAVMDFAYITGRRLSDMLNLEHRQIDAEGIHFKSAKTGEKQLIERTPALTDALSRIKAQRPVSGMTVICTRKGQRYSVDGFSAIWKRKRQVALERGLIQESFHWHDIRAKSATDAEEQGLNAQHLLGHTTPEQTRVYLRSKRVTKATPVTPKMGRKQ